MRFFRTIATGVIVLLAAVSVLAAGCGGSSDNIDNTDNSNTGGSGITVLFFTQPG